MGFPKLVDDQAYMHQLFAIGNTGSVTLLVRAFQTLTWADTDFRAKNKVWRNFKLHFWPTSFPGSSLFLPRGMKREDSGNEVAYRHKKIRWLISPSHSKNILQEERNCARAFNEQLFKLVTALTLNSNWVYSSVAHILHRNFSFFLFLTIRPVASMTEKNCHISHTETTENWFIKPWKI